MEVWHTCDSIVAHAAPAIPYPKTLHSSMSPRPLMALATAKAFKGPHESFMPRLETYGEYQSTNMKKKLLTISFTSAFKTPVRDNFALGNK